MFRRKQMLGNTIYDFVMDDIDGNAVKFDRFKGLVILVVNVASKCGFAHQYKKLQEIYERYRDKGFIVLGFPANNFLWQEPGSNSDIKSFCGLKYNVTFPMFSKISVRGKEQAPFYRFLTEKETNCSFYGKIKWNFTKFLINRKGEIVDRFSPTTKPNSDRVINKIEEILAET